MGDCQNYGPFLGPYYNTGPNTGPNLGDPKWDHNFDNPPHRPRLGKTVCDIPLLGGEFATLHSLSPELRMSIPNSLYPEQIGRSCDCWVQGLVTVLWPLKLKLLSRHEILGCC